MFLTSTVVPGDLHILVAYGNMRRASQNQFMRNPSQMSSPREKNTARIPQRERGRRRVADLLQAAALIESRQEASTRATELRLSLRRHVARILRARIPELSPDC
jgi:hypothetical protein